MDCWSHRLASCFIFGKVYHWEEVCLTKTFSHYVMEVGLCFTVSTSHKRTHPEDKQFLLSRLWMVDQKEGMMGQILNQTPLFTVGTFLGASVCHLQIWWTQRQRHSSRKMALGKVIVSVVKVGGELAS